MRYNLARMARRAGVRRAQVTLRPIAMPAEMKRDLLRIIRRIPQRWRTLWNERIEAVYAAGIDQLTRDDVSDDMAETLRTAEAIAATIVVEVSAEVAEWIERAEAWHRRRWVAAVQAGAKVDVFPFIDTIEHRADIQAMLERTTSLIRGLDDQARKDVAEVVWRGFTNQTPRRKVAKQIAERIGVVNSRARLIAIDQSQKIAADLTRMRQKEAGITLYRWRHSAKQNYRPHHKARDGKTYRIGEPAGDEPGMAIYCGCQGAAVLEIEDE
ncbi:minor capsid protein [Marinicauda sp. Alg238-R41]|uniref:minor capsid protein n=1 Tax=Marinicauda sp. Alg238-R41 TaxID=2993447 RepID=UPI0022E27541|nr:minor capsid protein [Marinicauda sp. Alg238-R41]